MTGILLSPGPMCNLRVVQCLSRVFMSAVNKAKFLSAANKLQAASLGVLVSGVRGGHVFIKKSPKDIEDILQQNEYQDLCTMREYTYRYNLSMAPKMLKIQGVLEQMGMVPNQ